MQQALISSIVKSIVNPITYPIVGFADSGAPKTLRQVSTRSMHATEFFSGNKQIMGRSQHTATEDLTSLQLVYGNWYVPSTTGVETDVAADTTVEASIEYPAGTYNRVTFAASNTGTMASGANIISDVCTLSTLIPEGAQYWINTWKSSTAGVTWTSILSLSAGTSNGEGLMYGVTTPNLVMGGTVGQSGGGYLAPSAIIANSNKPAIGVIGDSIALGLKDLPDTASAADVGIFGRGINDYAYLSTAQRTDRAQWFAAGSTKRVALINAYCTNVMCNFGINDNANARTAVQTYADLQTIRALFGTKPFFQTTMSPVTNKSTSNNWSTTIGQQLQAWEAVRLAMNVLIRANTAAFTYVLETADIFETARNSGFWINNGTPFFYVADGIHPQATADTLVADYIKLLLSNGTIVFAT
jgi:hypothetical protein